jgi:hypothetical protein
MSVFDIYKQAFDKRIKSFENKKIHDRILIKKSINQSINQSMQTVTNGFFLK